MGSIITEYEDFKKEMAEVLNKHINTLPAIFIVEYLDKLEGQFNVLAQRQLKEAADKESEVKEDGGQANNRAHSIDRNIE
jgi:hypothetical protein